MSPLLPQYSKIPEEDQGEGDRLLDHEDSRPSYPPTAGAAASSSSIPAAPSTVANPTSTFQLPSHLARYTLESQFTLWKNEQAMCTRGASREETISTLLFDFSQLANRDPSTIRFCVPVPPPIGSPITGPGSGVIWMPVSDHLWNDVIVLGKPDNILIKVEVTKEEARKQSLAASCIFISVVVFAVGSFAAIMALIRVTDPKKS